MEVQLDKRYPLEVSGERAWVVLSDIRAVAGCMPGAQITDQLDDTHYKGTVKSKVGPAVMTFNGDIEVLGLDVQKRRLEMLGKGTDKGGSSASMNLVAHIEPGATQGTSVLTGLATVTVSGKLAQFGGRLLVPIADAMLAQFADNFRAAAAIVEAPVTAPANETSVGPAMVEAAPPPTPSPEPARERGNELNALRLVWIIVKGWFANLFGKKTA
ncbi:SRPBCC family protein [Variovorax sp. dw_954]|uniref:SRPBCC family protein n=1 Tax=Variovorax sp. dw_954 TaxID=2720078 RepID=UPI001BD28EC1|nr:SRPBCC family protein [Variovorax sp. dw_954]